MDPTQKIQMWTRSSDIGMLGLIPQVSRPEYGESTNAVEYTEKSEEEKAEAFLARNKERCRNKERKTRRSSLERDRSKTRDTSNERHRSRERNRSIDSGRSRDRCERKSRDRDTGSSDETRWVDRFGRSRPLSDDKHKRKKRVVTTGELL